jgi:hypothetical protein
MFFQIFNRSFKKDRVVLSLAKHSIAVPAKNATNSACFMAVINRGIASFICNQRLQAYWALAVLTVKHRFKFVYRNTKFSPEMIVTNLPFAEVGRAPSFVDFSSSRRQALIAICFYSVPAITSQIELASWFYFFASGARFPIWTKVEFKLMGACICGATFSAFSLSAITANTTLRSKFTGCFIGWFKAINRLDLFALGALFFGGYSRLSHIVRTSITNSVIRLVREFAALVRADPILSRLSRNHNKFMTLCARAACRRGRVAISKQEREAFLCL